MSVSSTMEFILKKDKERLIKMIVKNLSMCNASSINKLHLTEKINIAEDVFSTSIEMILERYKYIADMNYQITKKMLFKIIRNKTKQYIHNNVKRYMMETGKYEEWKLRLYERQREYFKQERMQLNNRKRSRKIYYLRKNDPEKLEKRKKYMREYMREYYRRKKLGISKKDERLFDPNKPFKFWKDNSLQS